MKKNGLHDALRAALRLSKNLMGGSEGRRSATSIVAADAGRALRSFRLTPPGRFALRASAHRAHASLRPLRMKSEPSDMRGGFGSLAKQGFLTPFPAREPRRGERETAHTCRKRSPQASFFDTLRAARRFACSPFSHPSPTHWPRRRLTVRSRAFRLLPQGFCWFR